MPKTFPQELAEWVKKREASRARQDKNLVAFLALKSDVQAAMDAGYSLLTIWEHLHDKAKIPYRYETFVKHVRRHIKSRAPAAGDLSSSRPPDPPSSPATGRAAASRLHSSVKPAPPVPLAGFTFDSQPKKEDLL
ncbi:MAG: TraK protein of transfer system [Arthrobacter sp.]|nr:TraK protein of transfer system [Arthrobacter sp.]